MNYELRKKTQLSNINYQLFCTFAGEKLLKWKKQATIKR